LEHSFQVGSKLGSVILANVNLHFGVSFQSDLDRIIWGNVNLIISKQPSRQDADAKFLRVAQE
jgi:hypothetical protein